MRRATFAATLLAGLLAAPAPAQGQPTPGAGQVTFDNTFIGPEACATTSFGTRQVHLAWADQLETGQLAAAGVFKIVATNLAPTANTTTGAKYCPLTGNPNNTGGPLYAGQVGNDIPNQGVQMTGTADALTGEIAQKGFGGTCPANGATVFVCVQFYPYQVGTQTPTGTPTAWAIGSMTIALTRPSTPVLDSVTPGNQALNAKWHDPGTTQAVQFDVRAFSLFDPSALPSPSAFVTGTAPTGLDPRDPRLHQSGAVTGTGPYRLGGLTNGVVYAVAVVGMSAAGAESEPSNVKTVEAQQVNDFWQTYRDAGGQETGGCSSGVAGPLGLALLAGALALVRRRK
jgi:uncharacterized protein (TIGR03382 family)